MQKTTNQIIDFIKELIAIKSQNGIDSEKLIAQKIFEKLEGFGFSPKIIGPKDHPSVICYVKKQKNSKTIWLESCLDTVPAGDISKWKYDPFEAKIVGNEMFGRGIADSKVAIAIFCYLAKELSADKDFHNSIFLGFDADEQSGNFLGIREVIKVAPKSDICILGYQGDKEVSIGARGWLRLKLTVFGKSAHTGSRSQKGINAIHIMGKIIHEISSMKFENKKEPFFEFGSALNFSQIEGGIAINIVPDKCETYVDIRLTPSQNKDEIIKLIKGKIRSIEKEQSLKYSLKILQYEKGYLTDPQDKFVKILAKNINEVIKKEIPLVANGQGSVGNVISKRNIPIINAFGCESGNVHAPNEWVNVKSIDKVFEIYRKSLIDF